MAARLSTLALAPCALTGIFLLPPGVAGAQEAATTGLMPARLYAGIEAGAVWSDNLGRDSGGGREGGYALLGLDVGSDRQSALLNSHIDINTAYQKYSDNRFRDGFVGEAFAMGAFKIVPDKLEWAFQDNFSQAKVDPLAATGPTNRQVINVLSTGPNLKLSLGQQTYVRLGAEYSRSSYEATDFDNDRVGGSVGLGRQLSPGSTLSINSNYERTTFTDGPYRGYDTRSSYLSYRVAGPRTDLSVDAGYLDILGLSRNLGGPLVNLTVTRRFTPRQTLAVSYDIKFGDAGQTLRARQQQAGADPYQGDWLNAADPVKDSRVMARWMFDAPRTRLTVGLEGAKTEFTQSTQLNRNHYRATLQAYRRMTERLNAALEIRLGREEFASVTNEDFESIASLGIKTGQNLTLRVQLEHFDRSGTSYAGGFTENRIRLVATYLPAAFRPR